MFFFNFSTFQYFFAITLYFFANNDISVIEKSRDILKIMFSKSMFTIFTLVLIIKLKLVFIVFVSSPCLQTHVQTTLVM